MMTTNWHTVPITRTNATALATTGAVMVFLTGYQPEELSPVEFMRANAVLLIAVHGALHAFTLNSLKFLETLGVAEAKPALDRYRDPRAVSHLDLAAAWLGYYTLSPCIAML
jgi:hypothetical protein